MKARALAGLLLFCMAAHAHAASLVQVNGGRFERDGKPYRYVGANLWYGMNLGAPGAGGDRARLTRELDRLQSMGVTNLRVLAASEGPDTEPWRIVPAMQSSPGQFREDILLGLDFLLDEMRKRDMVAVMCLNNFWHWSGGMSQYLRWSKSDAIPYPPPSPGGTWEGFQAFTSRFYSDEGAVAMSRQAIRAIVGRVNRLSGVKYAEDPAIMAWQLANEPRGSLNTRAFNRWIDETAAFIKSLDPRHLVTAGVEGETPWPKPNGMDFERNHASRHVDYATIHIWAQNWGWFDPANPGKTYDAAVARMRDYYRRHLEMARKMGKPLVLEEFGIPRDGAAPSHHDPRSATTVRDRYYRDVFEEVLQAARAGAPAAGVNFWAWAGEGLPREAGGNWREGDPFTGDPPHEPQGWYGVYGGDAGTISVISEYARRITSVETPRTGSRGRGAYRSRW